MSYQQPTFFFEEEEALPDPTQWTPPEVLPDLRAIPHFTLDSETTGKDPFVAEPVGISLSWKADSPAINDIYLPFGHSSGNLDPEKVKNYVADTVRGKTVTTAGGKYDCQVLKRWGLDLEALGVKIRDVQFNAALLDDSPHLKVDLDSLGIKYAGVGKMEFPFDKNRMKELPSYLVGPYAERDTRVTHMVEDATLPLLRIEKLERVWELENSIIYAVCEIERNGCRLDAEKLERWRGEIRLLFQQAVMDLFTMTGMRIEPDSPVSMSTLFKHLNIEPPAPMAKKGRKKVKWNQNSLPNSLTVVEEEYGSSKKPGLRKYTEEELLSLKHPVFNKVVEARWYSSLLSKFLDKYSVGLAGDRLRSQFHQLKTDDAGTISGRFSSSGGGHDDNGYSFNAQQVIKSKLQRDTLGDHHIVRELFVPKDDMEYFSADLSQIEYRIATHFANAERIIAAYQDPAADFHAIAGALIQKYKPSFTDRTQIKNANFAYVFGSGPDTFAATAGISKKEATEVLDIMRRDAPEFPILLKNLAFEAEHRGFVSTIYGRRARFGNYEKRYYAALNRVVQGSAADIFKVYLKAIYDERKTLGVTALRQVVHDELNGDKEPGEAYTKRIQEFLNDQRVALKVPILWDLKTGANWKECH